ncbi:type II toxin-antitoxin system RelE/ParE family toxin [Allokutzneria sp. NRRL B-24872]|uniref:type II toxin-antitoxin system RelE family toxin n=1 Tax=Allokutzneria sp. NRRL B-24872 TaxID=1137961 RepID=UPI000A382C48|nr:hypothetical protein [Allokutzneria sp. NRRL B-24872]
MSYHVAYSPQAQRALVAVPTSIREAIEAKIDRYASVPHNLTDGRYRDHEVRCSEFVARCTIRHEVQRLTVMQIKVHLL